MDCCKAGSADGKALFVAPRARDPPTMSRSEKQKRARSRPRPRSYIDPREARMGFARHNNPRSRSQVDFGDVMAALELHRVQCRASLVQPHSWIQRGAAADVHLGHSAVPSVPSSAPRSRCDSLSSAASNSPHELVPEAPSPPRYDHQHDIIIRLNQAAEEPPPYETSMTSSCKGSYAGNAQMSAADQQARSVPRAVETAVAAQLPCRSSLTSAETATCTRSSPPLLAVGPAPPSLSGDPLDVERPSPLTMLQAESMRLTSAEIQALEQLAEPQAEQNSLIPLHEEETAFEGVTKSHLNQLRALHLQQQLLLLEAAKLNSAPSAEIQTITPPPQVLPAEYLHAPSGESDGTMAADEAQISALLKEMV